MGRFLWISLGGAIGTGLRYLVSGWAAAIWGAGFPYGTLAVNVAGSFVLGALMQLGLTTELLSPTLRVTLTIGLIGGFTTYSTFNYETLEYLRRSATVLAVANVVATLLGCLDAGWAGSVVGQRLVG